MNSAHNLYIHVPFCMSKCNYCAFFSHACAAPDWDGYANQIISEIRAWGEKMGRISIPTIFFGGGTPSLMPVNTFAAIMAAISRAFSVDADCEITIEANPGTMDDEKLAAFAAAGVNRLSVGVQRLDDAKLKFLGRHHDTAAARRLLHAGLRRGLRVSADFIYGLPGDTGESVAKLVREINTLGLSHCSLYELTIEAGTPLAAMNPDMPDNNAMAEMYEIIQQTLNLPRYEVSNYATPGDECRHNQNIWDGASYIGIGRGAAGRPYIDGQWYEQMGGGELLKPIDDHTRAVERVLTGMRTMRGIRLTPQIRDAIDMEYARGARGLIEINENRCRATRKGILILDDLMLRLIR